MERFWYFNVSKVSLSEEFCPLELFQCRAFASTRLNHSYTSLDASEPHKHTYTPMLCSQKPPLAILGQFRTTTDTNWHQASPIDVPRYPKSLRMFGRSGWHQMPFAGVWWCLLVPHVVWRRGEGVWVVSQMVSYWKTLKCKIPHISQSEYQNRLI